jgi:hypothetical protein
MFRASALWRPTDHQPAFASPSLAITRGAAHFGLRGVPWPRRARRWTGSSCRRPTAILGWMLLGAMFFSIETNAIRATLGVASTRWLGVAQPAGWRDDWKILPELPPLHLGSGPCDAGSRGHAATRRQAASRPDARLRELAMTRRFPGWARWMSIFRPRSGRHLLPRVRARWSVPLFDQRQAELLAGMPLRSSMRRLSRSSSRTGQIRTRTG